MSPQSIDFILRMLERLDEKMDNVIQSQADHKSILAAHADHLTEYNQQLKEHIRRTDLLEQRLDPVEKDLEARTLKQSFIAAHWKKISVVAGIIAALAGAIWSGVQIYLKLTGKM